MRDNEQQVERKLDTKALFYCDIHGMIEPERFDPEWTTDEGCPAQIGSESECGGRLLPVDLSLILCKGPERWTIFVCGCKGKVHEEEWATDDFGDGPVPVICGRCKQEKREIVVGEVSDV